MSTTTQEVESTNCAISIDLQNQFPRSKAGIFKTLKHQKTGADWTKTKTPPFCFYCVLTGSLDHHLHIPAPFRAHLPLPLEGDGDDVVYDVNGGDVNGDDVTGDGGGDGNGDDCGDGG